jgi:hypothetical protein
MGHESPIELWSPNVTTFCFVGFGTDRLRRQKAMNTAGRENPNNRGTVPRNRAHGAVGQNSSRLIKWAAKQGKLQPKETCFFLTSTFIELTRSLNLRFGISTQISGRCEFTDVDCPRQLATKKNRYNVFRSVGLTANRFHVFVNIDKPVTSFGDSFLA